MSGIIKKIILALFTASAFTLHSEQHDIYSVKLRVRIPRVYDNTSSQGCRSYQMQTIVGSMTLNYESDSSPASVSFSTFTNLTQKTSTGKPITYVVYEDENTSQLISLIGSNKTKTFSRGTAFFNLVLEPSYNINQTLTEDNSLYAMMSSTNGKLVSRNGRKILRAFSGYVVGTMGCSCSDYGHISPTRLLGFYGPLQDSVTDIAAIQGQFKISLEKIQH